eukprot:303599-Amphidinium_carterae.1
MSSTGGRQAVISMGVSAIKIDTLNNNPVLGQIIIAFSESATGSYMIHTVSEIQSVPLRDLGDTTSLLSVGFQSEDTYHAVVSNVSGNQGYQRKLLRLPDAITMTQTQTAGSCVNAISSLWFWEQHNNSTTRCVTT